MRNPVGGLVVGAKRRRSFATLGLAVLAVVAVVAALVLLLGPVTQWTGGSAVSGLSGAARANAIDRVRKTLLQAAGGTAALTALVFTARTYFLNRRGQVSERYATAISQLASDKLDERIGGIYALEHIMIESARDHDTIVQVLCAFIREHAPIPASTERRLARSGNWVHPPAGTPEPETVSVLSKPATDVQTALTVLGRRPEREERQHLDLSDTFLRGASLRGARLSRASLHRAHLEGADLAGAHLEDAGLGEAHLERSLMYAVHLERAYLHATHFEWAVMREVRLDGASMIGTHFEDAFLARAHLERTWMYGAYFNDGTDLDGAHLDGADLSGAHFGGVDLSRAHLEGATGLREVGRP